MITLEQYKRLVPLEEYFVTITRAQYKRASTRREDDIIIATLKELNLPVSKLTCAKCVYNMYERIAKLYYEFQAEFEHLQKIKQLKQETANLDEKTKESDKLKFAVEQTKERVVFLGEQISKLDGVKGKEEQLLTLKRQQAEEEAKLNLQQAQYQKAVEDELKTTKELAREKAENRLASGYEAQNAEFDKQLGIAQVNGEVDIVQAIEDAKYHAKIEYLNKLKGLQTEKEAIAEIDKLIAQETADYQILQEQRVFDKKKENDEKANKLSEEQKEKFAKWSATIVQSSQAVANVLGTVSGMMEDNIRKKLEDGKISEREAEKEFERVKKVQLAEVWINTLAGAAGAYMQAVSTLGVPWGIITGTANFAAAMALGTAQHKQIKAQTLNGNGGGGSNGVQAIAVQPLLDDTETMNSMRSMQIMGGYQSTDTRVYILESDITDSINRVEVRESQSDF